MIELERTYLAKFLPDDLTKYAHKEITDHYFPLNLDPPTIRLRQNGDKFELTKKAVLNNDVSEQKEETVSLEIEEFLALEKLPNKTLKKTRFYYPYHNHDLVAEIDIFMEDLKGLVVVEFEFENKEQQDALVMPDFCLADVTTEDFIAGSRLAGKAYADIESHLSKWQFKPLTPPTFER